MAAVPMEQPKAPSSAPAARRSSASGMQRLAGRLVRTRTLSTEDDGLFYPQIEKIGALKAAFAIIDGKLIQDELDRSVVTGNGLNSRELRK